MKKYFLLAIVFLGSVSVSSVRAEEVTAPKKAVMVKNFASKKSAVMAEDVTAPMQDMTVKEPVMDKTPVMAEEVTAPEKEMMVNKAAMEKNLAAVKEVIEPKKETLAKEAAAEKISAMAEEVKAPANEAVEPQKVAPDENLTALRQRMANNKSLTEANQSDLAAAMAGHFSPGADLRAPENEKSMLYFEQVANDPNMKIDEKLALIKKFTPNAEPAESSQETAKAAGAAAVEPMRTAAKVEAVKTPKKEEKSWFGFSKK